MNIIEANVAAPDAHVAITIARFNNFINDSLLEGAIDALKRIGQVKDANITVVWVPRRLRTAAGGRRAGENRQIRCGDRARYGDPRRYCALRICCWWCKQWHRRMLRRIAKFLSRLAC